MDDIEISLAKIRRNEAMRITGWGSLSKDKTQLALFIRGYAVDILKDEPTLTFSVSKNSHTTINGNATHSIHVKSDAQSIWQQPRESDNGLLIAVVTGKFKSFDFTMKMGQIKQLKRLINSGSTLIKLTAIQIDGRVRITWNENGRLPSPTELI